MTSVNAPIELTSELPREVTRERTPKLTRELTRNPLVKAALRARWPQLVLRVITLAGFVLAILSGFIGTPVGNHNFSIVFVWIIWDAAGAPSAPFRCRASGCKTARS